MAGVLFSCRKINTKKGRLAMTEAAYFGSKGQQDSFNMLGVEKEICKRLEER